MLVSVIIPCYNVEDYIEECISSVINQTYALIEILCVDNNSTDRTVLRIKALQKSHPSLQLLSEQKPGAPFARNKGLNKAKGEYIQFLDADDLLQRTKIEHQVSLIKKSDETKIGFVAGASVKRDLNKKDTIVSQINPILFVSPFINKCGNTCSNLWSKEALIVVDGWNENIKSSQESELMMRLVLSGRSFLVDNEPLTIIRVRESGQISHRDPESKWIQFIEIRLNYLKQLKSYNREIYDRFEGTFMDFLMVSVMTLAKYNRESATEIYEQSIKNNWTSSGSYGFNRFKLALVRTLGFKKFVKLYNAAKI